MQLEMELEGEYKECWNAFLAWNGEEVYHKELWEAWKACWTHIEKKNKKAFDENLEEMYNSFKQDKMYDGR